MTRSVVADARMNAEAFLAWSARQPDEDRYEGVGLAVRPGFSISVTSLFGSL
jgi:hypothetical protein